MTKITCPGLRYVMRVEAFPWALWFVDRTWTPELEREYRAIRALQRELDPQGLTWRRHLPESVRKGLPAWYGGDEFR